MRGLLGVVVERERRRQAVGDCRWKSPIARGVIEVLSDWRIVGWCCRMCMILSALVGCQRPGGLDRVIFRLPAPPHQARSSHNRARVVTADGSSAAPRTWPHPSFLHRLAGDASPSSPPQAPPRGVSPHGPHMHSIILPLPTLNSPRRQPPNHCNTSSTTASHSQIGSRCLVSVGCRRRNLRNRPSCGYRSLGRPSPALLVVGFAFRTAVKNTDWGRGSAFA